VSSEATVAPPGVALAEPDVPRRARRIRWWAVVAAFVAILLAAEGTVRLLEDRLTPPARWPTKEFWLKERVVNRLGRAGGSSVVIVGSSVVDIAVDPARMPLSTRRRPGYNASLIGIGPIVVDAWTRLFVVKKLRPDTLVIGLSSRDLNKNASLEEAAQGFSRTPGAKQLLGTESTADRIERRLSELSALLRYRSVLQKPNEALRDYVPAGQVPLQLTDSGLETHLLGAQLSDTPAVRTFFRQHPLHNFALSASGIEAIERLIAAARRTGSRVVLLDVPITDLYISLHPRGQADYVAYQAAVDQLAARSGAEVVRPGVWDPALFSDPLHLNGRGMRRLSADLDQHLSR
jgi:hypothetical protein